MKTIICAFAGRKLSLNVPFGFGKTYLEAKDQLKDRLKDKVTIPNNYLTETGFIAYDEQTKSFEILNRWSALPIAKKANQVKPEYFLTPFFVLESFMLRDIKISREMFRKLYKVQSNSLKSLGIK